MKLSVEVTGIEEQQLSEAARRLNVPETFLVLNGKELNADADEGERIILAVASGTCGRDGFLEWIRSHIDSLDSRNR
jgi:prophage maintenance system killer protein